MKKDKLNSVVAIIPARGGSKGVPGKNIKNLNGKPLIAYTILASLESQSINRTIVSTDDNRIAKIAKDYGADVPLMRPANIAKDDTLDFPVIKHVLEYLIQIEQVQPEIMVFLRPTMPTRTPKEIDEVVNLLIEKEEADCVRTIRPAPYPPYWMKKINSNGYLDVYDKHVAFFSVKRRQDLPDVVICDGYVDAARVRVVINNNEFPTGKILPYLTDNKPFIDIDTEEDWAYCEYIFKKNNSF